MISCCEFARLLIDYVANELAEADRRLMDEHLDECPPCVVYLETYRLTIRLSSRLPDQPVPSHLEKRLRAALVSSGCATGG